MKDLLNMRTLFTVTLITFIALLSSCQKSNKPSDLPKLYHCSLTFTQERKPLVGAIVDLVAEDANNAKYTPVQRTDEKGIAVMTTYGYDGVPAGKYKVVVTKDVEEEVSRVDKDTGETIITDGKKYRTVEVIYSDAATTPHKVEVSNKGVVSVSAFDVGKIVKLKK
jgi:hypothetical protein